MVINKNSIRHKESNSNSKIMCGDIVIYVFKYDKYCILKIPGRLKGWKLNNCSDGRDAARWINKNKDHIKALRHEDDVYPHSVSFYGIKTKLLFNKIIKAGDKEYIKYNVGETGNAIYYDYKSKIIHLRPKSIAI